MIGPRFLRVLNTSIFFAFRSHPWTFPLGRNSGRDNLDWALTIETDLFRNISECPQFAHHVGYLSKVTLALISPMLSPERPRLITEDRVVAEHWDDDGTFWQRLDLDRRMCLIGGTVPHHRRAGRLDFRTAHRAAGQQEHHDQQGGALLSPAFGVGSHLFSPMLQSVLPAAGTLTGAAEVQ